MSETLVLGLGNLLLGDAGFGAHAIARMRDRFIVPDDVDLVDGGTLGLALLPVLEDAKRIILIDVVETGQPAGTVTVLGWDDLPRAASQVVSASTDDSGGCDADHRGDCCKRYRRRVHRCRDLGCDPVRWLAECWLGVFTPTPIGSFPSTIVQASPEAARCDLSRDSGVGPQVCRGAGNSARAVRAAEITASESRSPAVLRKDPGKHALLCGSDAGTPIAHS